MRRILFLIVTALLFCSLDYPDQYTLNGYTDSSAVGQKEHKDGLVLHVKSKGADKEIFLENFEMLGHKGISVSATTTVDDKGKVVSYDNVVIKGIAAKIKSATGFLLPDKADVVIQGKALGIFNFTIHFRTN